MAVVNQWEGSVETTGKYMHLINQVRARFFYIYPEDERADAQRSDLSDCRAQIIIAYKIELPIQDKHE